MENGEIRLVKVDPKNFDTLVGLSTKESQKGYVASNAYSLAEAYACITAGRYAMPFGIYDGETPVGFLMIGYDYQEDDGECEAPDFEKGSYLIWRFMIDKEHQGKGYGKKALQLALDYIRTFPCGRAEWCWLSYEPENEAARELYRSFGFAERKELPKGWSEIPALKKL